MKCNFYLDRPYNPEISMKLIRQEQKKAKDRGRRLSEKFLNPRSTSIYVFLSPAKGVRIKHRTPIKIEAKYWDFDEMKIRKTAPGSIELNLKLEEYSNQIIQKTYTVTSKEKTVSENVYKKILIEVIDDNNSVSNKSQFESLIGEFLIVKSRYVKDGTMKEYKTVFKALKEFSKKNSELTLMDFDKDFYIHFESFLSKKVNENSGEYGLMNDTIYKYISTLRVFLRWCHENGYEVPNYTFKNHKSPFKKKAYNEIVVLTEDELDQLAKYDFSERPSLERVRDLFLFMAYTGQRFSDVMRFSKADFKNNKWEFVSLKSKKKVIVPFNGYIAKGLKILEKYDFKLPVISNQKFNNYLKDAGKMAEINEPVRVVRYKGKEEIIIEQPKYEFMSSHMGRRTAVTILLSRGVPITLVQKLTQHSKISTLMKYESAGTESLIDALNKF